jgi:nicotinamidase-related amidase
MDKLVLLYPAETVLLVIDVQRALFTRPNPVHQASKLIETINALVSRAQLYGVLVIYIQHTNDSILKKGTDGWKLHPRLSPTNQDLLIITTRGNALLDTRLQSELEARRIRNLIITGLVTEGGIKATSLGGLKLDYRVFLVKGGHSNYNKDAVDVIEKREKELLEAGVFLVSPDKIDFS